REDEDEEGYECSSPVPSPPYLEEEDLLDALGRRSTSCPYRSPPCLDEEEEEEEPEWDCRAVDEDEDDDLEPNPEPEPEPEPETPTYSPCRAVDPDDPPGRRSIRSKAGLLSKPTSTLEPPPFLLLDPLKRADPSAPAPASARREEEEEEEEEDRYSP
ncbi:hypothetical protein LTR40_013396, partial [Exophiala xenobiotica]